MAKTNYQDLSTSFKALIIIEFIILTALFYLVFFLNHVLGIKEQAAIASNFLAIYAIIFAFTTQLAILSLGLYNPRIRENQRTIFRRLTIAFIISYFICSVFNYFLSEYSLEPILLGLMSLSGLLITFLLRQFLNQVGLFGLGKRRVLVLGAGERASIIEKRMRRAVDRQSFTLYGFIRMPGDLVDQGIQKEKVFELGNETLLEFATEHSIQEIIVASDERRGNTPTEDLFACKIRGIEIIEILDFIERETGQVAVNLIYPSWVIYSNGFSSTNYLRTSLDWILNTLLATFIFILTSPFMLLAALAIKLEDGWKAPVFYRQERTGMDGKPFKIVKFRSMNINAEKDGAVWSNKEDSRVTRTGVFIRKYRIDELPQLYNVFRGEMGFVGPRPERPEFVSELAKSIPYYNQRHNVKPGLTGWAQLKYPYGATEEDARQKLHYDLYYIKHRSILLDLHILIRTAEVVLFGKGR